MTLPQPLISAKGAPLSGHAVIPGDKSCSHRALILGAIASGETIISGLLESEDVMNTAAAVRAMGAKISSGADGLWRIKGVAGAENLKEPEDVLDMGNSGTSARLLAGLAAGAPVTCFFTGDASLRKRPMGRVIAPLEQMSATFFARAGGRLPLAVRGAEHPVAIEYRLPVASAQIKSAILLAGLRARGRIVVIEETPTRDYTENMLNLFGVQVDSAPLGKGSDGDDGGSGDSGGGGMAVTMEGGQSLRGCAFDVPRDPSSAAFAVVAAAIHEGSDITLPFIGVNPRRTGLFTTLQDMGADLSFVNPHSESGEQVADLHVTGKGPLKGVDVPPGRVPSMIDEFPVLAVAAACAEGTTRMRGLAELRVKESDRLMMMAQGLRACGVALEMGQDSLTIHGTGRPPAGGARIETALDHRIAMSFLVLGSVSDRPVVIDDGAPIATSFPGFVSLMNELGAGISPQKGPELEPDVPPARQLEA